MESTEEADPATLLISVLRHLPILATNAEQAEGVFGTIRNSALRANPSLPYVPRVLSKVSALAISARDSRVREVATAACASLVTCLSRTVGSEQAACYILGLCDALSNIHSSRARGSKGPIKFLEDFEAEYVNSVSMHDGNIDSADSEIPFSEEGLTIYPSRQPLRAILALLLRTMPVLHRKMHHTAEQMYAGMMWVAMNDTTRNIVAMQLSHPVLLTGCQGWQPAIEAAKLLLVFVENVAQSPVAKIQMRNRVGASFVFHVQADCDEMPDRSELIIILLKILHLVSSSSGICPKVWSEAGVQAVVRGSPAVAEAAARTVESGFVANLESSEISDIIFAPSMSSRKRPRYRDLSTAGSDVVMSPFIAGDDGNGLANVDGGLNLSNTNSNLSLILFDINTADAKLSGSEQLLIISLIDELKDMQDVSHLRRLQYYERLCFLTAARCGMWKSSCSLSAWRLLTVHLLSTVGKALQLAAASLATTDCSKAFALCQTALELLYMTMRETPREEEQDVDSDSSEDIPLTARRRRTTETSEEETPVWRGIVSAVLGLLEKLIQGGDSAFSVVDVHEIPNVVRQLAQLNCGRELFLPILPSGFPSKLHDICSGLLERSIEVIQADEKRDRFITLLACYPTMVLVCPLSKVADIKASVERLKQLVISFKENSVSLACSSLVALGHSVCISARCRGDHQAVSSGNFRPCANDEVWGLCYSLVEPMLKSSDNDKLLGGAAKCFGQLTLHCPPAKLRQCIAFLVQCVWHPVSVSVRRIAMRTIEILLVGQKGSDAGSNSDVTHQSSTSKAHQDSWDGPDRAFQDANKGDSTASRLGLELKAQLAKSSLLSQGLTSSRAVIDEDPRTLSLIARLPSTCVTVAKASAIALDALIAGSVNDLHSIGPASCNFTNDEATDGTLSRDEAMQRLRFWNELLFVAASVNDSSNLVYGDDASEDGSCGRKPWLAPAIGNSVLDRETSNRPSKRAQISELASFLASRMKDWLPLTLERMLSTPFASKYVAAMLLENESALWKKVLRYALGTVLRDGNSDMLDSLAIRLNTSKRTLVEVVCADAIARSALMSPVGIDLRTDGSNKLIQEVMRQPLQEIVCRREGKIVQRVVMELGGVRDAAARRALESLCRILSPQPAGPRELCMSPGQLVSRHFLLVMDAANRVLLFNDVPEHERVGCLRMLESVFKISKENLHMYVPKVFATLKICLSDNGAGTLFKEKTIEVWATFLSSLGAKHVGPHLGSMLALLLPQVPKYAAKIVPVLRNLIENGKPYLTPVFPEILLLFRTVTHPSLKQTATFLEKEMDASSSEGDDDGEAVAPARTRDGQQRHMPSPAYQADSRRFEDTCLQFLNVATRHESSEIRLIALDQLLEALRANRHQMETLLNALTVADTADDGSPPVLAMLVNNLLSLVSESMEGCDMKALECLGELGAIDPALIMPHAKACRKQDGTRDTKREETAAADREFPKSASSLARFLLEVHLAPALWRSDRLDAVGSRLNRVGLAIQELLKTCNCTRETAIRAKESAPPGVIEIDDDIPMPPAHYQRPDDDMGVNFWTSLSQPVQTAAQPYLLEPFDVQKYANVIGTGKKGDIEAACTSIWDKLDVDGRGVVVEEWRRQVVFQAIDFIGGEGKFGALFRAVRPSLRYEHGIVSSIFPHVVMMALDFEHTKFGANRLCAFMVNELKLALSSGSTAVQCVFSLLDVLRTWRDDRALEKGTLIHSAQRRSHKGKRSRGPPVASFVEAQKDLDPLSSLVCLHGRTSEPISLFHQARAALAARAYPRAVMLAEQHVRNTRFLSGNYSWPASMAKLLGGADLANASSSAEKRSASQGHSRQESVSLSVLQRAFAELEDADSLSGIAALRKTSTLAESIVDAEASGNFDDALLTYERALAQCPGDEKLHTGFLRCLCTLGHWETMLAHATGLANPASSASRDSESVQRSTRSLGIEAAWRLSRWDHLDELCKGGALQCNISSSGNVVSAGITNAGEAIGRTLLHVHHKDWEIAGLAVKQTRAALLPHIAHAALEGYSRAYPMLVQLHTLADVEDVAEFSRKRATVDQSQIGNTEVNLLELARMNCRSRAASVSLRVREPLLSVRRACLEMFGYRSLAANVSIELAQLARESGNLRAATAAASHALSNTEQGDATSFACGTEMARIQRTRGDDAGALLCLKKVIEGMTNAYEVAIAGGPARNAGRRLAGLRVRGQNSIEDDKKRLCAAHVLAGQWIEESRSESSEVILWHYGRATQYCPGSDQAFYALGRYYYSLLQAGAAALGNGPEAKFGRRILSSQSAGGSDSWNKIRKNHYEYVPLVIQNFSTALQNGHARLYEALPRLLTVWFDFYTSHATAGNSAAHIQGVEPSVRKAMHDAFSSIPLYMWMSVVPQLMSRLLHSSAIVRTEVTKLLSRLLVRFPDQCVWLIMPSTQLKAMDRKSAVRDVLNGGVALAKRAAGSSSTGQGSTGSRRTSASAADKAAAKQAGSRLRKIVQCGLYVVKDLIFVCKMEAKIKKGGGHENCREEFSDLRKHLQMSSVMVPTLRALTASLPGNLSADGSGGVGASHRAFAEEPVTMVDVEDDVLVMSSLMQPRRVGFTGSDGRQYRFLAKRENNGDMRKDSRLMDFVTVVNRLLAKDSQARERDLQLKTYAVIPLTEETGMIEWVNDLAPLRVLVREEQNCIKKLPDNMEINERYHQSLKNKRDFLENWALINFPPMLDKFFIRKFARGGDAAAWLAARTMWTRSVAVWSMTGYIVGLGDRHAENILVETTSGRAVHVDFAMLFDKGASLKVPEVTPFRLTPNMVGAFGIAGTEGGFRVSCEVSLRVLRGNSDGLMGTLESFLHDPLADWNRHGSRYAMETRHAVRNKLRGIVDASGIALSIQGQVQKLIADATSLDKLSQMYIWWAAWT